MKKWNRCWLVLGTAVSMLLVPGCSSDDIKDLAAEEAVEAGLDEAMTTTVVPLIAFYGAIGDFLAAPAPVAARGGFVCPDTSGWCTSGTATCTSGANSLAFDFDECVVVTGDEPLTVDGNLDAVPGTTVFLTMTNLFINNSPAMNGTGSITTSNCSYVVNLATTDATVSGLVIKCDADNYPTGDTLNVTFGNFLVVIIFDGSNIAHATATRDGDPVANCTINMAIDPLSSSCDAS